MIQNNNLYLGPQQQQQQQITTTITAAIITITFLLPHFCFVIEMK